MECILLNELQNPIQLSNTGGCTYSLGLVAIGSRGLEVVSSNPRTGTLWNLFCIYLMTNSRYLMLFEKIPIMINKL